MKKNARTGRRASMPILKTTCNDSPSYAVTWVLQESGKKKHTVSFAGLNDEDDGNVYKQKDVFMPGEQVPAHLTPPASPDVPGKQTKKSKIISTFNNLRRSSMTAFRKEPKDDSIDSTTLNKSRSLPADLVDEGEEDTDGGLPKFHKDRNILTYTAEEAIDEGDGPSERTDSDDAKSDSDTDSIGHVNILFQFDEDLEPAARMTHGWKFGKKGSGIGDLQDASHITYVSKGKVYVTDMINSRITLFSPFGTPLTVFHGDEICEPWSCVLTQEGHIAVTSRKEKCVVIISENGNIVKSFGHGFFRAPSGIAIDKSGHFIVSDVELNRISIHDRDGFWIKNIGDQLEPEQNFNQPRYVTVSLSQNIIVSDSGNNCIKLFDDMGVFVKKIGRFGSRDGEFKFPYGVCTDNLGDIYVADHYNNRISMFSRSGEFVRHLVTSAHDLKLPQSIVLSPELDLYVTHGGLKACEVSVFKLQCHTETDSFSDITSYV